MSTLTFQLEKLLKENSIVFEKFEHPPLHTCEDADHYLVERPGARLKNLFLRDNYGKKHFLLITAHNKNVDLKALSKNLNVSRLGFASHDRLNKYLSSKAGAVSILSLMMDKTHSVKLLIDEDIWQANQFQCHPFINTQTFVLDKQNLMRFLTLTGHDHTIIPIPIRSN